MQTTTSVQVLIYNNLGNKVNINISGMRQTYCK
jgi:hypothetical protein